MMIVSNKIQLWIITSVYVFLLGGMWAQVTHLPKQNPVETCFKVHSLIKSDNEHYWATFENTCSFTIEQVYVMVDFVDPNNIVISHGRWAMYGVEPKSGRYVRFSTPKLDRDFETIRVHGITTDTEKALKY